MQVGKFLGDLQRNTRWEFAAPRFAKEFKEHVTDGVNLRSMHPIGALNMVAYMGVDPFRCFLVGRHARQGLSGPVGLPTWVEDDAIARARNIFRYYCESFNSEL